MGKHLVATIIPVLLLVSILAVVTQEKPVSVQDYDMEQSEINTQIDMEQLAKVSIPFIENVGQADDRILFYANIFSGSVLVTDSEIFYLLDSDGKRLVLKEDLGQPISPTGLERSKTSINYFKGPQENWKTDVPSYDAITLSTPWQNINAKLRAYGSNVEKIITVHPEGSPSDIIINLEGPDQIRISESGELVLDFGDTSASMTEPVAYQIIDDNKVDVAVRYDILDDDTFGFFVEKYDTRYDLVIDPLISSTFLGGSSTDRARAIAIDSSGNVFVAGETTDAATDLPTTTGAFDETHNGGNDAFVSKFTSDLTTLSASTFLGGSGDDRVLAIAIDSGNVFVAGRTVDSATDLPTTTGAFDETHNGGNDAFVSKFTSDLTTLSASTFLGGGGGDFGNTIAIDSSGNVFVAGQTIDAATDLPTTTGAFDETHNGGTDAFVSKFTSDLTTLSASTFLGGGGFDRASAIAIDSGNVFVAGRTADSATDLPTTTGAFDETHNGGNDAFVSKFTSDLTTLSASTFLGGSDSDEVDAITIDSGNILVAGRTTDAVTDLPTTTGAFDETHNGGTDAFVSKFTSDLTTLSASTFLGGSGDDRVLAIAIDSGNVFVAGDTVDSATDLPTTTGAFDETHNGGNDAFVSKFTSDLTTLSASTFLGGSGVDRARAIAIDSGNVFVAGDTVDSATDLPTTTGAFDETHNGGNDAFVSKFDSNLSAGLGPSPSTGGGSGCDGDCQPPTLGIDKNLNRIVSNGFSYNGKPVDVEYYFTPYPLITVNVGKQNTAVFKIYENMGPDNIRHFDFAFGLEEGQILSESKARIEWDKTFDGKETVTVIDPQNALDNVSVKSSKGSCTSDAGSQCLILTVRHTFRESLEFDMVATNTWDQRRNSWQNYYNDGIHIVGAPLNPPQTDYMPSGKDGLVQMIRFDKFENLWVVPNEISSEKFDNLWVDPNGIVYTRNDFGSWFRLSPYTIENNDPPWNVMTRYHDEFSKLIDDEIKRATLIFDGSLLLKELPDYTPSMDFDHDQSRKKTLEKLE